MISLTRDTRVLPGEHMYSTRITSAWSDTNVIAKVLSVDAWVLTYSREDSQLASNQNRTVIAGTEAW